MGAVRYIGPYRIAHELELSDIETIVIDRFYQIPHFFSLLKEFLHQDVVLLGISTTFLTPPHGAIAPHHSRHESLDRYFKNVIVDQDILLVKNWFVELRFLLDRHAKKAKIIIGGTKSESFRRGELAEIEQVDYLAVGSFDLIFPEVVLDIIKTGRAKTLPGSKNVIDSAGAYLQKKDCPTHEWLPHWLIGSGEALPIEISRGCAFNCKFCNYEKKSSYRKPVETLKKEFIKNYENFSTTAYHFLDDCFNDSREKVETVCNMILSLPFKIEWVSYARFDVAVKYPETADLMIASGARGLYWGIESLNYDVARKAGKGTPPEKIKSFLVGFFDKYREQCLFSGSFISGLPGETEESWFEQVKWLLANPCLHFWQKIFYKNGNKRMVPRL